MDTRKRKRAAMSEEEAPVEMSKREVPVQRPKKDWNPDAAGAMMEHSGGIYQTMLEIPKVAFLIVDTPAFQRMDRIRQLGMVNYVYRQATNTRMEHLFGTAHLASKVMQQLRKVADNVTGNDMLCVTIAALCHDLGHGPYSHTFEGVVKMFGNVYYRHEKMSIKIFDHILETHRHVKQALDEFLEEDDYTFIRECIDPPAFPESFRDWKLKGRGPDKAFLYEIVSNTASGFDVDKIDYVLRDSHHTSVPVNVDLTWVSRIIRGLEVIDKNGMTVLAFDQKLGSESKYLYDARQKLYSDVYFHKKLFPLEHELKKAIKLAAPFLKYRGTGGKIVNLIEAVEDVEAFIKLDDSVLTQIINSLDEHEDMKMAQKCIDNILNRRVPTTIIRFDRIMPEFSFQKIQQLIDSFKMDNPDLQNAVQFEIKKYDHGKGVHFNPTTKIFYSQRNRSPQKDQPEPLVRVMDMNTYYSIFVYGDYGITTQNAEDICDKIAHYWKDHGFPVSPNYMFK